MKGIGQPVAIQASHSAQVAQSAQAANWFLGFFEGWFGVKAFRND